MWLFKLENNLKVAYGIIKLVLLIQDQTEPQASLIAQSVRNLPEVQETWARFLSWKDSLEKEMASHSNIVAWRIPWIKEPSRLQPMGSKESDTT